MLGLIRAGLQTSSICRSSSAFNQRFVDTCPNLLSNHRLLRTMATAATVNVTSPTVGGFGLDGLSNDSANRASKVLQENHEKHHIYFNHEGFHGKLDEKTPQRVDSPDC